MIQVDDTKEDEETRAMRTRETIDPVEPTGADGSPVNGSFVNIPTRSPLQGTRLGTLDWNGRG